MHWLIVFHENDFKMRNIIHSLRQDCYEMDPKMIEKYNLCRCHSVARPNLRELKFIELDIPEPAAVAFQKKLDSIGFLSFKPSWWLQKIMNRILKILFPTRDFKIEWSKETTHRYNSRSFIIGKVHDDSPENNKDVISCPACKGNIVRDWL